MRTHVKVLGVVYLAVGACMLLLALFLALTMGSVTGIVGATAEPQDAAIAIPILGIAGMALVVMFGVFSLPSLITGYGLLYFKSWARIVGIVLSAVSLINFPLGTAVGVYGLWVLLNKETERLFDIPQGSPITPAQS
jgi:hypothetical protein